MTILFVSIINFRRYTKGMMSFKMQKGESSKVTDDQNHQKTSIRLIWAFGQKKEKIKIITP